MQRLQPTWRVRAWASITKRLVENGGGTIALASEPGVGTTFTFTFPA